MHIVPLHDGHAETLLELLIAGTLERGTQQHPTAEQILLQQELAVSGGFGRSSRALHEDAHGGSLSTGASLSTSLRNTANRSDATGSAAVAESMNDSSSSLDAATSHRHYLASRSEGYPSGQRGLTVNQLAHAFGGSNPPPSTSDTAGVVEW